MAYGRKGPGRRAFECGGREVGIAEVAQLLRAGLEVSDSQVTNIR
jgi:hypothetical protein